MEWLEKLYTSQWTSRFQKRAASVYGHLDDVQTLAEDAASMTAMKLSGHTEQEASDALILTVFKNSLTDCVRERHGFPRPRKWLQDMGDLGVRLFKLICLEGKTRSQVSQWVSDQADKNDRIPAEAPSVESAQALALSIFDQMQEVQECSPWRRQMARETSDDEDAVSPFAHLSNEDGSPEDQAAFDQVRHFIECIAGASEQAGAGELDRLRLHALADSSWAELGLDDKDRLVMSAYLGRGLLGDNAGVGTELDIAQDLGLSVAQIRNRRKKVCSAMGKIFL